MGMLWEQICADPVLAETPHRVVGDDWSNLVMSPPAGLNHSQNQGRIQTLLGRLLKNGEAFSEFPLQTSRGVKAIDVVWISEDRLALQPTDRDVAAIAPEICIEVISPSNSRKEIEEKMQLYFEQQAKECWTCDRQGEMAFHNPDGPIPRSAVCPDFPPEVHPPKLKRS